MSLRRPTSALDSPLAAWLGSLTVGDSERKPSAGQRQRDSPCDVEGAGAGLVQRCVVVQKDQLGFGFTVCGERLKLVQNVRAGGAAVKAGVREGDRIIKVNGSLVSSMSHQEVVKLIKSGTYVALTLQGPPPSPSPDAAPAQRALPAGGETAPAPPSPSGPSGSPSQRITGPKPLRDSQVQKHASQILRKMLRQEETELRALMEERGRNPSPSLEERIQSAKRRARQVRLKLLPDAGGTRSERLAGAVTGLEGRSAADSSEGDAESGGAHVIGVRNIIQRFESHSEDGGDPRTASSEDGAARRWEAAQREAPACCRAILRAVDEAVGETERRRRLSEYQRRLDVAPQFKGLDLSTKKMIHEGPLVWKVSKDKQLDIQALLLSDCLLLLQRGPDERLSLRQPSRWPGAGGDGSLLLRLDSLLVRPVATDNKALYVISTKETQIYELLAGTASEKNTWKDFLEKTIAASAAGPSPALGGASPLEAADGAAAENAARTQDRAGGPPRHRVRAAGVARAALRDVETLRRLLLLTVAREDVWRRDLPDESLLHPREAALRGAAQVPPEGNVFHSQPGESATDPTDEATGHGRERDPSELREEEAGRPQAPRHVVGDVEGVFRTIEDLTSKLRQLKDMEGEHRKLLTSPREPSAPREEEDRGRADGKEASPAQPRIQTTGL